MLCLGHATVWEVVGEPEYKIKFKGILAGYYISVLTLLAILDNKAGTPIPTPKILKENILAQLAFGLLLILPYNIFMNFILEKISSVPLDEDMPPEKFKSLMRKSVLLFLIGIFLMVLTPWSLDMLLPPFNS
ncbi:MAG: hypothetical protein ACO1OF_16585 [Adhaeribacter sp.]